jgi:hypothetical protein
MRTFTPQNQIRLYILYLKILKYKVFEPVSAAVMEYQLLKFLAFFGI